MELLRDRNELASEGGKVNAITTRATHEYLTRVRTALADIPATEVDDLLDDVRPHLADIAAEIGPECTLRDMITRLGTPEQYAAELRSAGDYPPAPTDGVAVKKPKGVRFALWSMLVASFFLSVIALVTVAEPEIGALYAGILFFGPFIGWGAFVVSRRPAEALDRLPEVAWFRSMQDSSTGRYLQSLAPGWWIGAALIFIGSALVVIQSDPWGVATVLPLFVILAGFVVFAGHHVSEHRAWKWATVPLSAMAIGCVIGGLSGLSSPSVNYGDMAYQGGPRIMSGLMNEGEPVTNIFGFTKDGQPITEFYLVDQNGQPINVSSLKCDTDGSVSGPMDNKFPNPVLRVEGAGPQGPSELPEGQPVQYGECTESNDTPFTVAIPQTSAPTTTPTTPAPETTVTPAPEVTPEPVPTP